MCGIAGWFEKGRDFRREQSVLKRMSESLARRGPDDQGYYLDDSVCLIHRRLAVIDVENGRQPMAATYHGKKAVIVYNGELYNSPELRGELQDAGMLVQTHSDTELVLLSYLLWGEGCVEKLNGIFAFAVRDEEKDCLFLARDRIGVKPLFFYPLDKGLLFASEVNCLLQHPAVRPEVDEQGLYELFLMGPGRSLGQGIYRNVGELLPGECAVYDGNGLRRRKYFSLHARPHEDDLTVSVKRVRSLLTDSIERQLISDVPLCCFLSGGLDSSIISYTAANYCRRNRLEPVATYSIDYAENEKYFQKSLFQPTPDSEFIGIMARFIGSRHHSVTLDNRELFGALRQAVDARDFPGMTDVDASLLLFCRQIREDFTVALSGECADELFGGYPWYHNREILFEDCFPWARSTEIRRSVLRSGFLPRGDEYVRQKYLDTCTRTEKLPTDSPIDARMREMFALNFEWFMQTLLDRKDRMSMYNGLEVRVPFCDYRIVEYAFNLPWEFKAYRGREKGIVREAFRGILPDSIIDRKKSPYPKTHHPLYFRLCAEAVRELLHDRTSPLYGILDPEGVEDIIQHPDKIASPWYGQLMRAPQILAYLLQLDYWFRKNGVQIV